MDRIVLTVLLVEKKKETELSWKLLRLEMEIGSKVAGKPALNHSRKVVFGRRGGELPFPGDSSH